MGEATKAEGQLPPGTKASTFEGKENIFKGKINRNSAVTVCVLSSLGGQGRVCSGLV